MGTQISQYFLSLWRSSGVTTDPENTIGIKTNNSTLSCVASGNPTITWHKEGTGLLDLKTESTDSDGSVTSHLFLTDIKVILPVQRAFIQIGGVHENTVKLLIWAVEISVEDIYGCGDGF